MSLAACLPGLVERGELSPARAKAIEAQFAQLNARLAKKMAPASAAELAGQMVLGGMERDLLRDQRLAVLAHRAQTQGLLDMASYGDKTGRKPYSAIRGLLDDTDFAPYSNVRRRGETLFKKYQGGLYDFIQLHRRDLLGRMQNEGDLDGALDVIHGGSSDSPHAKLSAKAMAEAMETARQDFNAAGGHIGKVKGGYFPHRHDPTRVRDAAKGAPAYKALFAARKAAYKEGRVAEAEALDRELIELNYTTWRDFQFEHIDVAQMRNPRDGAEFDADTLEEAMRGAFEAIRTNGLHGPGTPDGGGFGSMLANQRAEHRFFVYKSGASWRAYAERFGDPNAFNVFTEHLHGMARDTALMQRFGPNPPATFRYFMDQAARQLRQSGADAETALFNGMGQEAYTMRLWDVVTGKLDQPVTGPILRYVTRPLTGARNLVTSAYLGSSTLTGLTDFNTQSAARAMAGMPQMEMIRSQLKQINPANDADRRLAVEMLAGAENATRSMLGLNRYFDDLQDAGWTSVLADMTLRLSGNSAMFEGGQRSFHLDMLKWFGHERDKGFDALSPELRETFGRNGIDAQDWDAIRSSTMREDGASRFPDPGQMANRDLSDRMMDMVGSEVDRAVQGTSPRARALFDVGQKGTSREAVMGNILQFKNFVASLTLGHANRIMALGPKRGAAYAAKLVISMWMMGAVIIQLKELSKANDLRPMDNGEFWFDALLQSGGLAIIGDLVGGFVSDRQSSILSLGAGATPGMIEAGQTSFVEPMLDDNPDNNLSGVAPFLKSNTPVLSSLWYTRAAFNLVLLAEIREAADPGAAEKDARALQRLHKQGQGRWMSRDPDSIIPNVRAPSLGTALGEEPPPPP